MIAEEMVNLLCQSSAAVWIHCHLTKGAGYWCVIPTTSPTLDHGQLVVILQWSALKINYNVKFCMEIGLELLLKGFGRVVCHWAKGKQG